MRKAILLGLIVLLAAPLLAAQNSRDIWGGLLKRYGEITNVEPGAWAVYRMHSEKEDGTPETMDMKMSCVAKEEVDGEDGLWLETEMDMTRPGEEETATLIMKMFVVGNPADDQSIKQMIMQMGEQPPMLMPIPEEVSEQTAELPEIEDLGMETVEVPAGTFKCHHLQAKDDEGNVVDIYLDKKISMYGIVKMQMEEAHIELTKHGATGAVSKIKGEPRPQLDLQHMMKEMMNEDIKEKLQKVPEEKK